MKMKPEQLVATLTKSMHEGHKMNILGSSGKIVGVAVPIKEFERMEQLDQLADTL